MNCVNRTSTEHQQCVVVKRRGFRLVNRNLWCPTGLFAGTIIFIMYINDLPGVISKDSPLFKVTKIKYQIGVR